MTGDAVPTTPKPAVDVPEWAVERGLTIAHQIPGLWPGKIAPYLAFQLWIAFLDGEKHGLELAAKTLGLEARSKTP